jgi:FlaA1/EpsC-like NDP-sugar epimerase
VLGTKFVISDLRIILVPAIIIALFALLLKPAIIFGILTRLGYKPRTSFMSGISLAQISEFSLILLALGLKFGYLSQQEVSMLTLAGIISIALSSYGILFSRSLYEKLRSVLSVFERAGSREQHGEHINYKNHIILIGAHRLGEHVVQSLKHQTIPFVIVDFNPEMAERYAAEGVAVVCGDITDPHIQEHVSLSQAKLIISTVPDLRDNILLAEATKRPPIRTRLVITAQDETEAIELYNKGVDYVILPHYIGGIHLSKLFKNGYKFSDLKKLREHHLKLLQHNAA